MHIAYKSLTSGYSGLIIVIIIIIIIIIMMICQ